IDLCAGHDQSDSAINLPGLTRSCRSECEWEPGANSARHILVDPVSLYTLLVLRRPAVMVLGRTCFLDPSLQLTPGDQNEPFFDEHFRVVRLRAGCGLDRKVRDARCTSHGVATDYWAGNRRVVRRRIHLIDFVWSCRQHGESIRLDHVDSWGD